jgi:hypothetical protein
MTSEKVFVNVELYKDKRALRVTNLTIKLSEFRQFMDKLNICGISALNLPANYHTGFTIDLNILMTPQFIQMIVIRTYAIQNVQF